MFFFVRFCDFLVQKHTFLQVLFLEPYKAPTFFNQIMNLSAIISQIPARPLGGCVTCTERSRSTCTERSRSISVPLIVPFQYRRRITHSFLYTISAPTRGTWWAQPTPGSFSPPGQHLEPGAIEDSAHLGLFLILQPLCSSVPSLWSLRAWWFKNFSPWFSCAFSMALCAPKSAASLRFLSRTAVGIEMTR
jgi:hypothetical protein